MTDSADLVARLRVMSLMVCVEAADEIERLTAELHEVESRRDLAIANYVRTLAERDALTDRLIRAGLKS